MKAKSLIAAMMMTVSASALTLTAPAYAQGLPNFSLETVSADVQMPWGMAWLPNGDMLVTDRNAQLYRLSSGRAAQAIDGLPEIHVNGQGGLLDIVLHPDYASNGWIYISFSDPSGEGEGSNTSIMRAKLDGNRLVEQETLYQGDVNTTRGQHYGGRMIFNDGYLFFTIGDRGDHFNTVQDLSRDGGKTYRIHDDGRIPADNPFVNVPNAIPAIWSYGHRNQQGIAINPLTGAVWTSEHGPRGGDEINIPEAGKNYGWPNVGYGVNYNGDIIAEETHGEGIEQPIWYWDPSIATAGIEFVSSDRYPELKNHLLVGGLRGSKLELLEIWEDRVIRSTDLITEAGRIREIRQGPDGFIYVGVEGEGIKRLIATD